MITVQCRCEIKTWLPYEIVKFIGYNSNILLEYCTQDNTWVMQQAEISVTLLK